MKRTKISGIIKDATMVNMRPIRRYIAKRLEPCAMFSHIYISNSLQSSVSGIFSMLVLTFFARFPDTMQLSVTSLVTKELAAITQVFPKVTPLPIVILSTCCIITPLPTRICPPIIILPWF